MKDRLEQLKAVSVFYLLFSKRDGGELVFTQVYGNVITQWSSSQTFSSDSVLLDCDYSMKKERFVTFVLLWLLLQRGMI